MELVYSREGKQVVTTIGEYVESLLVKDKYFNTPLPRIPVKVRQHLEKELAPLPQYRKRLEANRRTFAEARSVADLPVEVLVGGAWVAAEAKELVGRPTTARKLRVKIEDGGEVTVHLGKVVLRDQEKKRQSRSPSGAAGRASRGPARRSRSRSRGR